MLPEVWSLKMNGLEGDATTHMVRSRLTTLREQVSALSTVLVEWYEPESEVVLRAEQVDAAIQRLEWALDRTPAKDADRNRVRT